MKKALAVVHPVQVFSFLSAFVLAEPSIAQLPSSNWSAISSMAVINGIVRTGNIIWAATEGGVLRYDGSKGSYTRFTRIDGLAGNQVLSAVEDKEGNLWFGTGGDGLSKFVVSANRFTGPFSEFRELELNDLAAQAGRLYIASNVGISVFLTDVERVKENYRQFGSLPRDAAVQAVAVHDGNVWAGTEKGLAWADLAAPNLQDPLVWETDDGVGEIADLLVVSDTLFAAGGQKVWFWDSDQKSWISETKLQAKVSSLGLYDGTVTALTVDSQFFHRRNSLNWNPIMVSNVLLADIWPYSNARTLSQDGDALWVGTGNGLVVLGDAAPPPLNDPPANHFYEMALTTDGNLWVASVPNDQTVPEKGVFHFDGKHWSVLDRTTGSPSDLTVAVETDELDQLWVGTWGHGLAIFDSQRRWQHLKQSNSVLRGITEPDAPTYVVISDIERDRNGNMWLANIQAGLAVMDGFPPVQSFLNTQESLGIAPGRNIGKLAIGPDDLKWISTSQNGLIMFDDGGTPFEAGDERNVVINTAFDSRLGSDFVTTVYSNEAGVVWIGTDNGLSRVNYRYDRRSGSFEITTWRHYGLDNGLLSPMITDIEGDSSGNIWAGTRDGLTQLKSNGLLIFTYTTSNSSLIDNRIESLLFDEPESELWVGTFDGLARLQITESVESEGSTVTAYPNPLHLFPDSSPRLTFSGLPKGATVHIFSLDGHLVRQLEAFVQETSVTWDGRNEGGKDVDSGIFFVIATDRQGHSTTGKFAVIRGE